MAVLLPKRVARNPTHTGRLSAGVNAGSVNKATVNTSCSKPFRQSCGSALKGTSITKVALNRDFALHFTWGYAYDWFVYIFVHLLRQLYRKIHLLMYSVASLFSSWCSKSRTKAPTKERKVPEFVSPRLRVRSLLVDLFKLGFHIFTRFWCCFLRSWIEVSLASGKWNLNGKP